AREPPSRRNMCSSPSSYLSDRVLIVGMGRLLLGGKNSIKLGASKCRNGSHLVHLSTFHRILPNLIGTKVIQLTLFRQPIVAVEEIMPRAIKTQQVTEKTTVAVVITAVICLILIVAAMEAPIKFVLP